jgi:hypothetical protein
MKDPYKAWKDMPFLVATLEELESVGGDPFKEPEVECWHGNISENKKPRKTVLFCYSNWRLWIPFKK